MSEFSDSLHFYDIEYHSLVAKLMETGKAAFVLSKTAPISVIADWEDKATFLSIGKVLDFSFSDDHGISLKFYVGGTLVARANQTWGENFGHEEPEDSPNREGISDNFVNVLNKAKFLDSDMGQKILDEFNNLNLNDFSAIESLVENIGAFLKITNFRNLNSQDIQFNIETLLEINPEGAVNL